MANPNDTFLFVCNQGRGQRVILLNTIIVNINYLQEHTDDMPWKPLCTLPCTLKPAD